MKTYKNCYKIKYEGNVLKNGLNLDEHSRVDGVWMIDCKKNKDMLDPDFITFMNDVLQFNSSSWDLGEDSLTLLKGEPREDFNIHIDRGCEWTVNYICGSKESEMKWYKFKNGENATSGHLVPIPKKNKAYMAFNEDQVEHIDSALNLNGLYLMRIIIPHSVHNYSETERRWCFSMKNSSDRTPWEEIVEYFNKRVELQDV